jgi:hypothetical protein
MFGSDNSPWLPSIGTVFSARSGAEDCVGFHPSGSFRFISSGNRSDQAKTKSDVLSQIFWILFARILQSLSFSWVELHRICSSSVLVSFHSIPMSRSDSPSAKFLPFPNQIGSSERYHAWMRPNDSCSSRKAHWK